MTAVVGRVGRGLSGVAIAAALLLGIVGEGGSASAANLSGTWSARQADGCAYLWDGVAWATAVCALTDGSVGVYASVDGQWVFDMQLSYDPFGQEYTLLLADGTTLTQDRFGMLTLVRPDGTTEVSQPADYENRLEIERLWQQANSHSIDRFLAPACNSSYNGCA